MPNLIKVWNIRMKHSQIDSQSKLDKIIKSQEYIKHIEYVSEIYGKIHNIFEKQSSKILIEYNTPIDSMVVVLNQMPIYKDDIEWFNNSLEFIENQLNISIEDFTHGSFHYVNENDESKLLSRYTASDIMAQMETFVGYSKMLSKQYFMDYYLNTPIDFIDYSDQYEKFCKEQHDIDVIDKVIKQVNDL
jgi:hypothetical protein